MHGVMDDKLCHGYFNCLRHSYKFPVALIHLFNLYHRDTSWLKKCASYCSNTWNLSWMLTSIFDKSNLNGEKPQVPIFVILVVRLQQYCGFVATGNFSRINAHNKLSSIFRHTCNIEWHFKCNTFYDNTSDKKCV